MKIGYYDGNRNDKVIPLVVSLKMAEVEITNLSLDEMLNSQLLPKHVIVHPRPSLDEQHIKKLRRVVIKHPASQFYFFILHMLGIREAVGEQYPNVQCFSRPDFSRNDSTEVDNLVDNLVASCYRT